MSYDQQQAASALVVLVALAGWWGLYVAWRTYRVDALRQSLFALRDRLFDYAASGAVDFQHPAYRKLRALVNSQIRFSHRLTFFGAMLPIIIIRWRGGEPDTTAYHDWKRSVATLPDEGVRTALYEFDNQLTTLIVLHLIASPLALLVMVCVVLSRRVDADVRAALRRKAPAIEQLAFQDDRIALGSRRVRAA